MPTAPPVTMATRPFSLAMRDALQPTSSSWPDPRIKSEGVLVPAIHGLIRLSRHRRFVRFLREAARPLGPGAAPADLREGPHRSGRSRNQAEARQDAARPLPRRLSAPRLSADQARLYGQARHAGPLRP